MFGDRQWAGNGHLWIAGAVSEAWAMSGLVAWLVLRDRIPVVYVRNATNYPGCGHCALDSIDFLGSPAVGANGGRSLRHLLGEAAGEQRARVLGTLDAIASERPDHQGEATRLVTFLGTPAAIAEATRLHRQLALPGAQRTSPVVQGLERLTVELASPAQIALFVSTGVRPELPPQVDREIEQAIAQRLLHANLDPDSSEARQAVRVLRSDLEVERAIALAAAGGQGDRGLTQTTLLDLVAERHPREVAALRTRLAGTLPCPLWWTTAFQVVDARPESHARLGLLLEDLLGAAARRHATAGLAGPMALVIEPGLLRSGPAVAELENVLRLGRRYGVHVVVLAGAELAASALSEHCASRVYDQRFANSADAAAALPWLAIPALAVNRPLTREEVDPDLLSKGRHAVAAAAFPVSARRTSDGP